MEIGNIQMVNYIRGERKWTYFILSMNKHENKYDQSVAIGIRIGQRIEEKICENLQLFRRVRISVKFKT